MNAAAGLGDALLNSGSDAIIATDRDGRITFWNPGAERIFGFTAEEAAGQSLDLIVPENLRARHWAGFRHTMETGTSRYGHGDLLSVPGLTKDGRRPTTTATTVRVRDGKTLTTDGPFAETREQLGGYYLVEAKDLDTALAIAARIPGAKSGSIEVRPVMVYNN